MRHWLAVILLIALNVKVVHAQGEQLCPELESRLHVGITGRVIAGGLPNNLRASPTRDSARLERIQPGEQFLIIGAAVCAEGYRWWRVDYNGILGWTPEADTDGTYWLEPLVSEVSAPIRQTLTLPPDLVFGIGGFGGGGGEIGTACIVVNADDAVPRYALSQGNGEIGAFDLIPFEARDGLIWERHESGSTSVVDFAKTEMSNSPLQATYNVYQTPGICTSLPISEREIVIIPPPEYDGEDTFAPHIYAAADWLTEIHLPVEAYTIPGEWEIQVGDFSLFVEVTVPDQPGIAGYIYFYGGGGLFSEGDPFALVGYTPLDSIAVFDETGEYIIVETDDIGNAVVVLQNLAGIFPESGNGINISFGLYEGEVDPMTMGIDYADALAVLNSAVWGN